MATSSDLWMSSTHRKPLLPLFAHSLLIIVQDYSLEISVLGFLEVCSLDLGVLISVI